MLKKQERQTTLSKLNANCVLITKILKYMYKGIKGARPLKCLFSQGSMISTPICCTSIDLRFPQCSFNIILRVCSRKT